MRRSGIIFGLVISTLAAANNIEATRRIIEKFIAVVGMFPIGGQIGNLITAVKKLLGDLLMNW